MACPGPEDSFTQPRIYYSIEMCMKGRSGSEYEFRDSFTQPGIYCSIERCMKGRCRDLETERSARTCGMLSMPLLCPVSSEHHRATTTAPALPLTLPLPLTQVPASLPKGAHCTICAKVRSRIDNLILWPAPKPRLTISMHMCWSARECGELPA